MLWYNYREPLAYRPPSPSALADDPAERAGPAPSAEPSADTTRRERRPGPRYPRLSDAPPPSPAKIAERVLHEMWFSYSGPRPTSSEWIAVACLAPTRVGSLVWRDPWYHHVHLVNRVVAGSPVCFLLCSCSKETTETIFGNVGRADSLDAYLTTCSAPAQACYHVLVAQELMKDYWLPQHVGDVHAAFKCGPCYVETGVALSHGDQAPWMKLRFPRVKVLYSVQDRQDVTQRRVVSVHQRVRCSCGRKTCSHITLLREDVDLDGQQGFVGERTEKENIALQVIESAQPRLMGNCSHLTIPAHLFGFGPHPESADAMRAVELIRTRYPDRWPEGGALSSSDPIAACACGVGLVDVTLERSLIWIDGVTTVMVRCTKCVNPKCGRVWPYDGREHCLFHWNGCLYTYEFLNSLLVEHKMGIPFSGSYANFLEKAANKAQIPVADVHCPSRQTMQFAFFAFLMMFRFDYASAFSVASCSSCTALGPRIVMDGSSFGIRRWCSRTNPFERAGSVVEAEDEYVVISRPFFSHPCYSIDCRLYVRGNRWRNLLKEFPKSTERELYLFVRELHKKKRHALADFIRDLWDRIKRGEVVPAIIISLVRDLGCTSALQAVIHPHANRVFEEMSRDGPMPVPVTAKQGSVLRPWGPTIAEALQQPAVGYDPVLLWRLVCDMASVSAAYFAPDGHPSIAAPEAPDTAERGARSPNTVRATPATSSRLHLDDGI